MRSILFQRNCETCTKSFDVTTKNKKRRFCSFLCARRYTKKGIIKRCLVCNKEVYKRKSQLRKTIFCSRNCHNIYQTKKRICKYCKKEYKGSFGKKYCSKNCRDKQRGNPTTKDGENHRLRQKWLKNNLPLICVICRYKTVVALHHIEGREVVDIYDISKVVTLCLNHHWEADHGFISKDDLYKFRKSLDSSEAEHVLGKNGVGIAKFPLGSKPF